MAKINELIYDVREAVRAYTDDSEISDRYIMYLYNIKRSKYLRQDLNNYQKTTDNSILQTLCMKLVEVSDDECCATGCNTILRTTSPIPSPIELHTKVALTKVKPTGRLDMPFNFISKDKAPYVNGSRFSNAIYAYLDNDNYIYVFSKMDAYKLLECLSVTGIFENPLDLSTYPNDCGCGDINETCFDEATSEYPLQPHYIDLIREEIVRDLIRTIQITEDKENNDTDIENERR